MDALVAKGGPRREARGAERGPVRLRLRPEGSLEATIGGATRVVTARPCFPWSEAGRHVSLRDADEDELLLLDDPGALDPASRHALDGALAVAGFALQVTRVLAIDEEVEIRLWRVETRQGARSFQTRLDEWPRELADGTLLLKDVAGDLYLLPAPAALDLRSRRLLWAFVD